MLENHRLEPGSQIGLAEYPSQGRAFMDDKAAAKQSFKEVRDELIELQKLFYADGRFKLLVIFQALDAGGKDGAIRNLFSGVNPQGVRVTSFKVPNAEELAHDFLWRVHKAVPGRGMIGVFNRSHYEDVLVVRVDELAPESVWRPRYEQINQFECLLAESGTTLLKFYLHISNEEQRERLQDRVDSPDEHWKFSFGDLEKRKQWPDYMAAYEEMLNHTSTQWAPWHVIPSDQKWYRNLVVGRTVVEALRGLGLRYPEPQGDLNGVVVV
ncbi:MAG: polyphosphate kinase 2 family protein [Candidatus Promineifilaceae bacterium]